MEDLLQTLLRKELISKPPIFEVGSDIENHAKKMEIFFKAVNITDSDTIKANLLTTLSDATNAKLACQADCPEAKDYNWIIEKLVKTFIGKKSELYHFVKLLDSKQ